MCVEPTSYFYNQWCIFFQFLLHSHNRALPFLTRFFFFKTICWMFLSVLLNVSLREAFSERLKQLKKSYIVCSLNTWADLMFESSICIEYFHYYAIAMFLWFLQCLSNPHSGWILRIVSIYFPYFHLLSYYFPWLFLLWCFFFFHSLSKRLGSVRF